MNMLENALKICSTFVFTGFVYVVLERGSAKGMEVGRDGGRERGMEGGRGREGGEGARCSSVFCHQVALKRAQRSAEAEM